MRQIYGYTESPTPVAGYVKFLAVFTTEDGQTVFEIRDETGKLTDIPLSRDEVRRLVKELI